MAEFQLPLTASLGQTIGPKGYGRQGTLGLYLRPGAANQKQEIRRALTCNHVVIDQSMQKKSQPKLKRGEPRTDVLLPTRTTLNNIGRDAKNVLNLYSTQLNQLETAMQCQPEAEEDLRKEKDKISILERDFRCFVEKELPEWESDRNCVLGYVEFAPLRGTAKSKNPEEQGPRRNWALIRIDQNKFQGPVTNVVDIETGNAKDVYQYVLATQRKGRLAGPYCMQSLDGKLRLEKTVPISELKKPKTLDEDQNPCPFVGKRGGATGMTWGCCNELKSVLLEEDNTWSMEWCVVPGIMHRRCRTFSEPGDSGSAVFDVSGRVVGIIHAGAAGPGMRPSLDTTYVTSMEWLQEDMKTCGYSVEIA